MIKGFWSIIVPEESTNMVPNPSIELDTAGYASSATSVSRVLTEQKFGLASLRSHMALSAGNFDGVYFHSLLLLAGVTYTFSTWFKGAVGVPYRIYFATTTGTVLGTPTEFVGTGEWQFVQVTRTEDTEFNRRLYVTKNNSASSDDFYLDGVQCEAKSYATTYIDGDQPDCRWTTAIHNSTSIRDGQSRAGGKEIHLDDLTVKVQDAYGIGMPSSKHRTQELSTRTIFKGRKVMPRTIQLYSDVVGSSRSNLHALRKELINAIKPDLVKDDAEFTMRYYGANSKIPLEIQAVYDSGLEFSPPDGFTEEVPLRLIAYEPYFREVGETARTITAELSVPNANALLMKEGGVWQSIGTLNSSYVRGIIQGPDGSIYICGSFTSINSVTHNRVAKWDGTSWIVLGIGLSGPVSDIVFGPTGILYAIGEFFYLGDGTTLVNRIAQWDGSSWSGLGTGLGGEGRTVAIDHDGRLIAGGDFTTAGGVAASKIARWNGSIWSAIGDGTATSLGIRDIEIASDGSIYVTGGISVLGGVTVANIARWNGTTWEPLGSGLNDNGYSLAIGQDGYVYVGGIFTVAGGITVNRIARWNGSAWSAMGAGFDSGSVYGVNTGSRSGLVYAGGSFSATGGMPLTSRAAVWNGSTWGHLDVLTPNPDTVFIFVAKELGPRLFLGYNMSGTAKTSALTTVTNHGSHSVAPKLTIKRTSGSTAVATWLKNETTGKTVWLNYPLLDGETLTLDFEAGTITSNFFGNVPRAVLRNSDFSSFSLLPGENDIGLYVRTTGSPTIEAYLQWTNTLWSADGMS